MFGLFKSKGREMPPFNDLANSPFKRKIFYKVGSLGLAKPGTDTCLRPEFPENNHDGPVGAGSLSRSR